MVGTSTSGFDPWNPATWTHAHFDQVRSASRKLFSHNEYAVGGALTRRNYVVGQGFKYEVVPQDDAPAPDAGALREFNRFVSTFCKVNKLPAVEKETQWRDDRDGETFLRLFDEEDGIPAVRFVEPERVGEPTADQARPYEGGSDEGGGPPLDANNALGVCTPKRDAQTVKGYWVSPEPNAPPEWVPEAEIVHVKCNADSAVRRGVPAYYTVFENLKRAEDTLQSMGTMAKARAKVALVEYVKNLTQERSDSIKGRLTTGYQTLPDGTARQTTIEEIPYGARLRVPDTSKLEFPSANVGAGDLVNVLQADLRAVAMPLNMTEWMFTGLADQKYSNAFVVEAPTLKAFSALQGDLVDKFGEGRYRQQASLVWRAIRLACARGVLPRQLLPLVKVKVTPPSLEVRDKAAEASVNQTYVSMGAKSVRKVIEETGGDPDQVLKEVAEEKKTAESPADPAAGGALPDLLGGAPTVESLGCVDIDGEWYTPRAARWVLEGRDYSRLTKKVITNRKGHKQTVYVRVGPRQSKGKRPSLKERAESAEHASRLIGDGVRKKEDAEKLAEHLNKLSGDEIARLKWRHEARTGGKTKPERVARLVEYAKSKAAERATPPDLGPEPPGHTPFATAHPGTQAHVASASRDLYGNAHVKPGYQFQLDHPHAGKLGKGDDGTPNPALPDAARPPVPDKRTAEYLNNYSWGYDGEMNRALRETGQPPPGKFGGGGTPMSGLSDAAYKFVHDKNWDLTEHLAKKIGEGPVEVEHELFKAFAPSSEDTVELAEAIRDYVAKHGRDRGKPDVDGPAMFSALRDQFKRAKPIRPPVTVRRGVKVSPDAAARFEAAAAKALATGGVVTLPGFQSATTGTPFQGKLQMEIEAVHGLDVKPYSHFGEEEELLLDHDSRYHVRAVSKDPDGTVRVKLAQLPPVGRTTKPTPLK
jgi:hypothetical protein